MAPSTAPHPDPEIDWLLALTGTPTAAGREHRVVRWVTQWAAERPDLSLWKDAAGNLVIERRHAPDPAAAPPVFITAHLDHPAFVVERLIGPGTALLCFRGGVLDPYFKGTRVQLFPRWGTEPDAAPILGTLIEKTSRDPFHECLVELDEGHDAGALAPGDVGRWALPAPSIENGLIHTDACDDLAALAAALATMERLRPRADAAHVRLLLTRAEEIGFIGAIAACKLRTMPEGSRVIALENSRSFAESPIGAGPIVRVGDRISTFSPALTAAIAKLAEALAVERPAPSGAPASTGSISTPAPSAAGPRTGTSPGALAPFRWQRKLMPGGACEASAYQAYGYESTCICLPLGNYHNMADLDRVGAGDPAAIASAKVAREFVSIADYKGMIDLLEACGTRLAAAEPLVDRLEKLYAGKAFVLAESDARSPVEGAQ